MLAGALACALAAAILPWAARNTRYGVAAVGSVLLVAAAATGTGVAGLLVAGLVWAFAANVAAGIGRRLLI